MSDFEKTVRLGTTKAGYPEREVDVFCRITLATKDDKGARLSISGVVGPKRNGDAVGSSGQIEMSRPEIATLAPGWDRAMLARFWETWHRWHLNDMKAGCEHQRATWHPEAEVEIVTYRLDSEAWKQQDEIKRRALKGLEQGLTVHYTADEREVMALPWETTTAPDADSSGSGRYSVQKRETKRAGWVYPAEHSAGLLMKPCEVCGYKYGSAWLFEEVPADVVAFLASLPDTDKTPAWG